MKAILSLCLGFQYVITHIHLANTGVIYLRLMTMVYSPSLSGLSCLRSSVKKAPRASRVVGGACTTTVFGGNRWVRCYSDLTVPRCQDHGPLRLVKHFVRKGGLEP